MPDIFYHHFMQRAFLVGTIAAVPLGLIGTFIVVRRIGYLAGAIAHCAFGGIGVGLFLQSVLAATVLAGWFPPRLVSLVITILAALLIGLVRIKAKEREDTIIGAVWAVGMALGLVLLNLTPGNVNISTYLFGDIIFITQDDVYLVASLSVVVLITVWLLFKRFEAVCFDSEFAKLRGINSTFYFQLLLVLTAVTVVLLVRVVGIVLVIAMLTLPAATACRCARRLFSIAMFAVLFGILAIWIGLICSVMLHVSASSTIVLTAAGLYAISFAIRS